MVFISEIVVCEVICRCFLNVVFVNFYNKEVYFENVFK